MLRNANGLKAAVRVGIYCSFCLIASTLFAAPLWTKQPESTNSFTLDLASMATALTSGTSATIELPLPDGSFQSFTVSSSEVMAPELAAKFPMIQTFSGSAVGTPSSSVQLDLSPAGFRAQIIGSAGTVYIDPVQGSQHYLSRHSRDCPAKEFRCSETLTAPAPEFELGRLGSPGNVLRTFRIAVSAQGEFTAFHGGTKQGAMAAIVSIINRVNGIYQSELGVRLVIVPNNDRIIYTDAGSDPFSANAFTEQILLENQRNTDAVIGSQNYDLGILLNTSGEGLAYGRSVCLNGYKAQSVVGAAEPTGDYFAVGYVAHEIGHQFGAYHTFNSQDGKCNGRRFPNTAVEPGSGSTLMSYGGICGNDDLQAQRDPYFHSISLDEIFDFLQSGSSACASISATGNNPPAAQAGSDYAIPARTAFTLSGAGSDPDGDPVTFCWEQRDLGPAQSVFDADNGSSPLFRSHSPTSNPSRTFLRLEDLLANTRIRGEQLPSTSRIMNFRMTVRDGRGGIAHDDMRVQVINTSQPFSITAPNSDVTVSGTLKVTWNVAATTQPPINTTRVNILLSTDGGSTFSTALARNTPNDGTETVILPSLMTPSARIKIEAVDNVFFDISDAPFQIVPSDNPKSFPINQPSIWTAISASDFSNDGQIDILYRNREGALAVQFLQGRTPVGSILMREGKPVSKVWRFVTLHDFNNDGSKDILWQRVDGVLSISFLEGPNFVSSVLLRNGQSQGTGWRAIGVGDFGGDGSGDIFLQHSNGKMLVWLLSGSTFAGTTPLNGRAPVPAGWQAFAIADLNLNNQPDILFRLPDGSVSAWLMNGPVPARTAPIRNGQPASSAWRLLTATDFNGDGMVDLFWRHNTGRIAWWLLDRTKYVSALSVP